MHRVFDKCPRCGAKLVRCIAYNGVESEFWFECTECNTYVNTYIPQPHQESLHEDDHTYIGNFGGYGTGKTLTSREEVYKHCFLTPNANVLIGANVVSQYEQTIKRELENDIPLAFVKNYSTQKSYMDLANGARIMYRPLADPDKLRSYNLTGFVIVEASEVKAETFSQLKTRLRNTNASKQLLDERGKPVFETDDNGVEIPVYETDWRIGIVESNPDSGWIKSDVLLASDIINKHGKILDEYVQSQEERDPATSSHVSSTEVNKFLPKTFIAEITKNKPGWWVSRYVYGSFSYAEGLVYPRAVDRIINYFEIPREWKRIIAFDYGLSDDSVYLFGAVDPIKGNLFIYKEVRTNNRSVKELAQLYFDNIKDIPSGGLAFAPIIDPKSAAKRDYDKKSLGDHFLEYGIAFEPGYINVDARIYRLNTYLESGNLFIMDNCVGLIKELKEYMFKPKTLDMRSNNDKPVDKNNHAINPLEWIVMRLPADPKNILYGVYNSLGEDLTRVTAQDRILPHALQDEPEEDDYSGEFSYTSYY